MAGRGDGGALSLRAGPAVLRYRGGPGPLHRGPTLAMAVSRRAFLSTAVGLPLATALFEKALELPLPPLACVLPESRAGFTRAMVGQSARNVVVFPAAGGFD